MFEIKNLYVNVASNETKDRSVDKKEILKDINLKLEKGKISVLMGPNGSGKTTLSLVIMGDSRYEIVKGKIFFDGQDITSLRADERARKGIFLSFQNPVAIPGVNIHKFLRQAYNSIHEKRLSVLQFKDLIEKKAEELGIEKSFLSRDLNKGFSGGEKKKMEILQLAILNPKLVILDETDSGLDIDALKIISKVINNFKGKDKTILIITHYKRILEHIKPDKIYVMDKGKIVIEGSEELVNKLEEKGYGWMSKQ